jgi:hypothetical protein
VWCRGWCQRGGIDERGEAVLLGEAAVEITVQAVTKPMREVCDREGRGEDHEVTR